MARECSRCGNQVGMFEGITSYGRYRRCRDCNNAVRKALVEWEKHFRSICADGLLTRDVWKGLTQQLNQQRISHDEAVEFIRPHALNFFERSFAFAKADGQIDEDEEKRIQWLAYELNIATFAPHIIKELDYLVALRKIRAGQLRTFRLSVVLPADELCYVETPATYRKVNKRGPVDLPGRLIVTNKKIIFAAASGGGEIPLNKVLNVNWHPTGIFLELSRQANNGFYAVPDAQMVAEAILAVIRMATRQLVATTGRDTRHIPQHVKTAVWQRDQGRCVQCNATEYLEFDHIIPLSKGGATSVGNLQILCRKCNLAKSDTI